MWCFPSFLRTASRFCSMIECTGRLARVIAVGGERAENAFSSRPEDLLLAIGPSICKDCYEVSEDVGEAFLEAFPFDEGSDPERREALKAAIQRSSEEKFHIDLWELNRQIALDASVPSENISISGYCTMERPDLFFSHRYSKGKRGVQGAFIGLKPVSREV